MWCWWEGQMYRLCGAGGKDRCIGYVVLVGRRDVKDELNTI
jgi:hypothetical protein